MSWFCKHEWVVIEKTYAGSCARMLENIRAANAEEAQRILQCSTDVLMQCSKCSKTKVVTMIGKPVEVRDA